MKKPGTTTRRNGTVRCAVYTRKSSEEGLEQGFNSLQAQREACEACTCPARTCRPVLFHAARPPQLSRAGYHPGDSRWAAAARFDACILIAEASQ